MIDSLEDHAFLRHLEDLADLSAGAYHYAFPPESGDFPTVTHRFNVAPDTLTACEEIAAARHRAINILRTFDKLRYIRTSLGDLDFTNLEKAVDRLEFDAENYFLRLPTIIDQLYALTSTLSGLNLGRSPSAHREFDQLLQIHYEELGKVLVAYRRSTQTTKNVRNVIAHMGEFVDNALDQMTHFVAVPDPIAWYPFLPKSFELYRDRFVVECDKHLKEAAEMVDRIFDLLLLLTRSRYQESVTADGYVILTRRSAELEDPKTS